MSATPGPVPGPGADELMALIDDANPLDTVGEESDDEASDSDDEEDVLPTPTFQDSCRETCQPPFEAAMAIATAGQQRIHRLRVHLGHSQAERQALAARNALLANQLSELTTQLENLTLANNRLLEENGDLFRERDELQQALARLRQEHTTLQENNDDLQGRLNGLENLHQGRARKTETASNTFLHFFFFSVSFYCLFKF